MKGHITYLILGVCLLGMFLVSIESARAYHNNGFQTNGVYVTELRRWIPKWDGRLYNVRESDGWSEESNFPHYGGNDTDYGVHLLDGYHWDGITFSGSGCDDARMFVSMTTYHTYRGWGTHTGANGSDVLVDSSQGTGEPAWGYTYFWNNPPALPPQTHNYALDNMTVSNTTDGSAGEVGTGIDFENGFLGTKVGTPSNPPGPAAADWYTLRLYNANPGQIKDNDTGQTLHGGTDNDFDTGDEYEIGCIPNSQAMKEWLGPWSAVYYGPGYCKPYDGSAVGANSGWHEWGQTDGFHGNDVIIAEYGPANGDQSVQLNYAYLYTDLLGISPEKKMRLAGNLRYNPFGNSGAGSLYIGVNEDVENDTPAKVYEVDLELTTVLNTYTGPNIGDEEINITVNHDDGTLYAIGRNLGSPAPVPPATTPVYGDLIAWDTSGGGTGTYTTLVDSDANGGYPNWLAPDFIAWRGTNNPSGQPTIIVDFDDESGTEPTAEFYLNATDGNGDLLKRGNPLAGGGYMLKNGQIDRITKTVWMVGERPNDVRGLIGLNSDDTHFRYPGYRRWFKWRDVATPGLIPPAGPCEAAPDIVEVLPDPDPEAYAGIEYIREMELEVSSGVPDPTWSLLPGAPPGAVITPGPARTATISGWTPTSGDIGNTFTFNVKAVNTQGEDTESWQVKVYAPDVLNNGFRKDWVYQIGVMIGLSDEFGQTTTIEEDTGEEVEEYWAAMGTNWYSLTFSGTGNNDARLFAIRPSEAAGQNYFSGDVWIAELDADANIINSAYLGVLAGVGQGNLGPNVEPHNIRYNAKNNTLMIGINPDHTEYSVGTCTNPGDCTNPGTCTDNGTCNVGTCGTPGTCTTAGFCTDIGTCDTTGQCVSLVCDSGPRVGEACVENADCNECVGGFSPGADCAIDDDCPNACYDWIPGDPTGPECTVHADCPNSCAGGLLAGEYCTSDDDCPAACTGGLTHGGPCLIDDDCVNFCQNGATPGTACTIDDDCPTACAGGSEAGEECTIDDDCPTACEGGANHGYACTDGSQCPDACEGGGTPGAACVTDADCPDATTTSYPLVVYEIDLGLTTRVATYTGPDVVSRGVGIDINPIDGTLYVANWDMGSSTPQTGMGDVIAFDTSGGSTSSYTTLIDGDTADTSATCDTSGQCVSLACDGGPRHGIACVTNEDCHACDGGINDGALCTTDGDCLVGWGEPVTVVYRGTNNPSGRPTILVLCSKEISEDVVRHFEFYLDETVNDPPGCTPGIDCISSNLVNRGVMEDDTGRNGQLDVVSGTVWFIADNNKLKGLANDDTEVPGGTALFAPDWLDADSPPGASICNAVVFADADEDGDVDQDDFGIFQLCYTGGSLPIPFDPEYCQCFDRNGVTGIDNADFTAFQDCATGPNIPFDPGNPPGGCIP
ncbi:MAG: hypothetical protein ACYTBZ_03320 [Planctomycetota bacterium]